MDDEAVHRLLRAAQAVAQDWENCPVADALNPRLLDDLANVVEQVEAPDRPVCGHTIVAGAWDRPDGTYEPFSRTCGRVVGHDGYHVPPRRRRPLD